MRPGRGAGRPCHGCRWRSRRRSSAGRCRRGSPAPARATSSAGSWYRPVPAPTVTARCRGRPAARRPIAPMRTSTPDGRGDVGERWPAPTALTVVAAARGRPHDRRPRSVGRHGGGSVARSVGPLAGPTGRHALIRSSSPRRGRSAPCRPPRLRGRGAAVEVLAQFAGLGVAQPDPVAEPQPPAARADAPGSAPLRRPRRTSSARRQTGRGQPGPAGRAGRDLAAAEQAVTTRARAGGPRRGESGRPRGEGAVAVEQVGP